MYRKILYPVCLFSFLLIVSFCQASSVSRTFSKTSASPGENINVNLTVSITATQDTYYAIDETYPSGWSVISTIGDLNQSGHVKFLVMQVAVNANHTYVIRAPAGSGTYTFSGLYMFENMTSEATVSGQTQVQVTTSCINSTFYRDFDNDGYGNASWIMLNCTAPAGYVNNSLDCNDTNSSIRSNAAEICGNGIDENCDGQDSACCGNHVCDSGETCSSCFQDCGQCPCPSGQTRCSDGVCRIDCGGGGGGGGGGSACTNGQTRSCSLSYKGYCASGNESCINGAWKGCPQPLNEVCNRIDDNCDGKVDEGLICECYEGETRPCGSDVGECKKGTQSCVNSHWYALCFGEVKPVVEVCNGADDNCDGQIDEGCKEQLSFKPCRDGEIPATGCICEQKIYSSGLCFSDRYYEGTVIRDWTMPIIGTVFVLVFAVIFIRWRHRHLKAQFKV